MANQKLKGTVKRVNRMRRGTAGQKVQAGTQGVIHAYTGAIGPFRFETDLIFNNGDHVVFELTVNNEVVNMRLNRR